MKERPKKIAILIFPGTNCDTDCSYVLKNLLKQRPENVWHRKRSLRKYHAAIVPGGFSFGDYLRPGAIARFSKVMAALEKFSNNVRPVVGICNGMQILTEAGLLPGALLVNDHLQFRCAWINLKVERDDTIFTHLYKKGQILRMPINHHDGRFFADDQTLGLLETRGQVIFRYCDSFGAITRGSNPNGSRENIAGITNERGNVLGMMPHPERACEQILGSSDGRPLFESILTASGLLTRAV